MALAASMSFQDQIRPESREAIESLKSMGLKPVMLTGDQLEAAELLARQAGLDEVKAGLLPSIKSAYLNNTRQRDTGLEWSVTESTMPRPWPLRM